MKSESMLIAMIVAGGLFLCGYMLGKSDGLMDGADKCQKAVTDVLKNRSYRG